LRYVDTPLEIEVKVVVRDGGGDGDKKGDFDSGKLLV